jgi:hypothetical protein
MIRAVLAIFLLCLITSACTLQDRIFGKSSPYTKPGTRCEK